MVKAILIDPVARVVSELTLDSDRDEVLDTIDAAGERLEVVPLSTVDHLILESMGAGRRGQAFWRFAGQKRVYAGKALMVGNTPDGTATQDVSTEATLVLNAVEWLSLRFIRWETVPLGMVETHLGIGEASAQVPLYEVLDELRGQGDLPSPTAAEIVEAATGRRAEPEPRPAPGRRPSPAPVAPVRVWSVTRPGRLYRAQLVEIRDTRQEVLAEIENETLDGLRGMLPKGLKRVPRTASDHDAIVESYVP